MVKPLKILLGTVVALFSILALDSSAASDTTKVLPVSRVVPIITTTVAPTTTTTRCVTLPCQTNYRRWLNLHHCEQDGNWYANGGNPRDPHHQTFQGGLGMSTGAWKMAVAAAARRGTNLPPSALAASPDQQMQGAQAFYDAYGWGWSCRV